MIRTALLFAQLAAAGCRKPSEPPADAEPRTRPLTSDGTLARELTMKPDLVKVQLDLSAVRTAIGVYKAEKGALPASLDELGVEGLNYTDDLSYDPASGEVKSLSHPSY